MFRSLCRLILHLMGWTVDITVPFRDKCIICVAPHTSNIDFFLGELCYGSYGRRAGFLMKKEWFFWPLGILLRKMGGIPVQRSRHCSLTQQLSDYAKQADYINLAITPEGTRSCNPHWKRGFYYIALGAGIPIQLFGIDGKARRIECHREIVPSGDIESDMRDITEYYSRYAGRAIKPHLFVLDQGER